jgi:PAS domain-containing protein
VIVLDSKSRVVDINPAAQATLGLPASAIIGKPIRDVYKPYRHLFDRFTKKAA